MGTNFCTIMDIPVYFFYHIILPQIERDKRKMKNKIISIIQQIRNKRLQVMIYGTFDTIDTNILNASLNTRQTILAIRLITEC